jgi:hypothetical protein
MNKTFYIETYGCQMNVADSDVVAAILEKEGYTRVTQELYLLNEATLTSPPDFLKRKVHEITSTVPVAWFVNILDEGMHRPRQGDAATVIYPFARAYTVIYPFARAYKDSGTFDPATLDILIPPRSTLVYKLTFTELIK